LYKIICLQFFICILLSVLCLCIRESAFNQSLLRPKLQSDSASSSLQIAPAVILTRPDERRAQAGTLLSGSSERSGKPLFRKQGATLVSFMLCYQQNFVRIKFCYADDQGTFCIFLHFISLVATIRSYYRSLECPNTTVCMFNRDRNFKAGIASQETVGFLALR